MKKFKHVRGIGAGTRAGDLNKFQHVQEVPMWSGGAGARRVTQVNKLEGVNKVTWDLFLWTDRMIDRHD